ncbi:hypothetical protein Plhal304r1_c035g0109401 [Plasmopara halstedii]
MASCTSLLLRDDLVSPILPIFTLEKTFERTTHAFQAVEFPRHQYLRMPILKCHSLYVCAHYRARLSITETAIATHCLFVC